MEQRKEQERADKFNRESSARRQLLEERNQEYSSKVNGANQSHNNQIMKKEV